MTSAPALRLELSASWPFAWLILLCHAAAAACLLAILTGGAGQALAILIVFLGFFAARDRALLRAAASPAALELLADGSLRCLCRDGEPVALARPAPGEVHRHWVALPAASARRRALLVTGGMLPAASFRQLRLWALWGRVPGVAARTHGG